jgi:hypothetical protein
LSPLKGSLWLAGSTHRIRYKIDQNGVVIPDRFTIDLLNLDDSVAFQILKTPSPALANDTLLGSQNFLNFTVWDIDSSLANGRYKLRISGVIFGQPLAANPSTTTGVFYIGPDQKKLM